MLIFIAGIVVFFFFALLPLISPPFFVNFLLLTGAVTLGFLSSGREFLSSFGGIEGTALKLFAVMMGGLVLLGANSKKSIILLTKVKVHILFMFYASLSLIWCDSLTFGLRNIAKHIAPLLLFIMFQTAVSSERDIAWAQKWTIFGGILIIIWALATYLLTSFGKMPGTAYRISIPGLNASPLSFYMLSICLLCLCAFYYQRKTVYLFLFMIFSMACMLPLTRITIGAWFVSLSSFLFLISKRKIYSITIMAVTLLSMFVAFTSVDALKKRTFYRPEEVSTLNVLANPAYFWGQLNTAGRSSLWSYALNRFFIKDPLIGSGAGSTQYVFYGGARTGSSGVMHSEYIRLLCEFGVVGACIYAIVFFVYIGRMYRVWRRARNALTKQYALAGILSLISFIVLCATDNLVDYIFYFSMYMFAYMAFALHLYDQEKLAGANEKA